MWKKVILWGLGLLVLGSILVSCGGKEEAVVKIALASPLTGDLAAMGSGMKRALIIAISNINTQNLLDGVKVVAEFFDDRADPKEAVNVANRIISDKYIVGVVGHLNSGCSIPASDVYARKGIVMVTPASTNPKLTQKGLRNVFRVCATDNVQGKAAAQFVYELLKIKKVAVIHDKTEYGLGLAEEFTKTFTNIGGKVLCFEGINVGDRDFKALLTKIKSLNPEAIYFGGTYAEGGLISRQANDLGMNIPIIGGDGMSSPEYIRIAGEASIDDYYTTLGYPLEYLQKAKDFIEKYKSFYPNEIIQPFDAYAYDASMVIALGLKEMLNEAKNYAGETPEKKAEWLIKNKHKLAEYLRKLRYEGVLGPVEFKENGDNKYMVISLYKIVKENGQITAKYLKSIEIHEE